ncbi:UNVERIFIED_CONTAM: hypothetical protein PYX00_007115 [Menopon gallinae]|uniref:PRELI/MSF1 domain-containing protein n=1 Tax=Menopon gallinae TaxID=328185 RepID=A0AAW2HHV8_9NEOP
MKYFETSTIFYFTWEQVAQGFWRRYPNPQSAHVLTEDTISREIKDGKLYSRRLLTKTNRVPKWGERFITTRTVKIVEESFVDPKEKVLVTYTRNIGLSRVMSIVEKVTYKTCKDNNGWTEAHRSAWIDSQVFGFKRAIISFGLDRFRKNCVKMVAGFNYVLATMFPGQAPPAPVEEPSQMSATEKLRGTAKKATNMVKSGASSFLASCEATEV